VFGSDRPFPADAGAGSPPDPHPTLGPADRATPTAGRGPGSQAVGRWEGRRQREDRREERRRRLWPSHLADGSCRSAGWLAEGVMPALLEAHRAALGLSATANFAIHTLAHPLPSVVRKYESAAPTRLQVASIAPLSPPRLRAVLAPFRSRPSHAAVPAAPESIALSEANAAPPAKRSRPSSGGGY
jgi:hypothetical protein